MYIGLTKVLLEKTKTIHQLIGKFVSNTLKVSFNGKTYFNGKDIFIINEKNQIKTYTVVHTISPSLQTVIQHK